MLLPRRSLLLLGGNSGNIAKHCISACAGRRISITLRKQPPPDWKPSDKELARKGDPQSQRRHSGDTVAGNKEHSKNNKPLSGSAKRRKKMFKPGRQGADIDQGPNHHSGRASIAKSAHGGSPNCTGKGSKDPALARTVSAKKKAEKQARRNARRLEKKKAKVAAAGVGPVSSFCDTSKEGSEGGDNRHNGMQ